MAQDEKDKGQDVGSQVNLNEIFSSYKLSTVGKLFLAGVAAWLVGRPSGIKVRATPDQVDVLTRALMSSKRLQQELSKPGATVQSVMDKLQLKNMTTKEFERKLGIPWPL